MPESKLIIVSNRLPVKVLKEGQSFKIEGTSGGLVAALGDLKKKRSFSWLGWAGEVFKAKEEKAVARKFREQEFYPVFLQETEIEHFYNGFCNSVLWPLFHYLPEKVDFSLPYWDEYQCVNQKFLDALLPICNEGDTVWIHDYQLFLLPELLRKKRPGTKIGFFLHIPFPSSEIYRLLPARREILEGILGADLVGFHTHDHSRHFSSSALRVLGLESTSFNTMIYGHRKIEFGSYPIGIEPKKFRDALKDPGVQKTKNDLLMTYKGRKLLLGVDRSDYTKGILQKFEAYERFLENNPDLADKVVLVQIAVPSRTHVQDYQHLKTELDQAVGRINGKYAKPGHQPIHYMAQSISFDQLCALYQLADVMLVTSIRDGMNLVSMEFTAAQGEDPGVLVLSEFAGAANSLGSSLMINPYDINLIADAIEKGLKMPSKEKKARWANNYHYVEKYTSTVWAERFVRTLEGHADFEGKPTPHFRESLKECSKEYRDAEKRFIFLDYDGTLVEFQEKPEEARPDRDLIRLVKKLHEDPKNEVYIVSGRPRMVLDQWFGNMGIGLAAEHGLFIKRPMEDEWVCLEKRGEDDWKNSVREILQDYLERTPGSILEEKENSLAWHYRKADQSFAEWQAHELLTHLETSLVHLPVETIHGKKVVEVRSQNVHKGLAILRVLEKAPQNAFIFCIGDDRTDEDMFQALPVNAWSIRVGEPVTTASFFVDNPNWTRKVLQTLLDSTTIST